MISLACQIFSVQPHSACVLLQSLETGFLFQCKREKCLNERMCQVRRSNSVPLSFKANTCMPLTKLKHPVFDSYLVTRQQYIFSCDMTLVFCQTYCLCTSHPQFDFSDTTNTGYDVGCSQIGISYKLLKSRGNFFPWHQPQRITNLGVAYSLSLHFITLQKQSPKNEPLPEKTCLQGFQPGQT